MLAVELITVTIKCHFLLVAVVWSNAPSVSAMKEFSLARYSSTAVYANNSVIGINLVGEGFEGDQITDGGALECHTDDTTCCRGTDNSNGTGRGEWYYPNGTVVPPPGGGTRFYRTRDHMVIRLNRAGVTKPTGVYRCEIPGAGGVNITRYISLSVSKVLCDDLNQNHTTYTPPREISATLPAGQRYIGTIATYSCPLGYQLVNGSSIIVCGPNGTWNGLCHKNSEGYSTTINSLSTTDSPTTDFTLTDQEVTIGFPTTTNTQTMIEANVSNTQILIGFVPLTLLVLTSLTANILFVVYILVLKKKLNSFREKKSEVELQDTMGGGTAPEYEVIKTKRGGLEYEEIDKLREQPPPPNGEYELTQCAAYGPVNRDV